MNSINIISIFSIVCVWLGGCDGAGPRRYSAHSVTGAPIIDGRLGDQAWMDAPWTADFIDIEGPAKPRPAFRTRAKMCWDDTHLYVAADMEEPHLWGILTDRDAIIYRDNDFEIFIDPDGDRLHYNEYEINVLGTEMDLRMDRPYRDGGNYDLRWDFAGVRSAVSVGGTIN
ncbi:MAG: carbohydrate-binding family 9-like protein, partial [Phycisphaerae bacterium]|nr:carbohydrate-binding family 9-like protein [Phycisphaerae bacterium]